MRICPNCLQLIDAAGPTHLDAGAYLCEPLPALSAEPEEPLNVRQLEREQASMGRELKLIGLAITQCWEVLERETRGIDRHFDALSIRIDALEGKAPQPIERDTPTLHGVPLIATTAGLPGQGLVGISVDVGCKALVPASDPKCPECGHAASWHAVERFLWIDGKTMQRVEIACSEEYECLCTRTRSSILSPPVSVEAARGEGKPARVLMCDGCGHDLAYVVADSQGFRMCTYCNGECLRAAKPASALQAGTVPAAYAVQDDGAADLEIIKPDGYLLAGMHRSSKHSAKAIVAELNRLARHGAERAVEEQSRPEA